MSIEALAEIYYMVGVENRSSTTAFGALITISVPNSF